MRYERKNVGVAKKMVQAILLAQFADLARLQRVRMIGGRSPDLERQPQRDRVTERVEERQDAEEAVFWRRVDRLNDRFAVGGDIAMGEHDAFGLARRARWKR